MSRNFQKYWFTVLFVILVSGVIRFFITKQGIASPHLVMSDWKLPLPEGNYRITQGDKDDPNTCQQGWSHCSDNKVLRCAIDLAAMKPGEIEGFPLLAPYSGKIGKRGWDTKGGGYYLYIEHDDGLISHYEHLREKRLQTGHPVQKGDCVGRVSDTGGNYSPHLHFVVLDATGQSCVKIFGIDGNTYFNYSPPPNNTIIRSTNRKKEEIMYCPDVSATPPPPPALSPLPPPSTPNNPPNKPSLVSPRDVDEFQNQSPKLCAKENGDPDKGDYITGYFFQIYDSAQNWDSGWTNSSCVTTTPLGYFTYKWHVKVRDTQGRESEWSGDWRFSVREGAGPPPALANQPPNAPSLVSPDDDQEFHGITPQLCARDNGDPDTGDFISAYRFEIYDSTQNWDSGWIYFSCITPSSLPGNSYKWHARVRDSKNAESGWSEDRHFTIRENNPPYPPTLLTPENGQVFGITPQSLCAKENGDPDEGDKVTSYRFEIFEGAQTWDSGWVFFGCTQPPVLGESVYRWHAKVRDLSGEESEWSDDWKFTIGSATVSTPDITDPVSIAAWFNQSLQAGDLAPFEFFLADPPEISALYLPDGPDVSCNTRMGEWCGISKEDFLRQISLRVNSRLMCFYLFGNTSLILEISNWDPPWSWPWGQSDGLELEFSKQLSARGEYVMGHTTFFDLVPLYATTPCP